MSILLINCFNFGNYIAHEWNWWFHFHWHLFHVCSNIYNNKYACNPSILLLYYCAPIPSCCAAACRFSRTSMAARRMSRRIIRITCKQEARRSHWSNARRLQINGFWTMNFLLCSRFFLSWYNFLYCNAHRPDSSSLPGVGAPGGDSRSST